MKQLECPNCLGMHEVDSTDTESWECDCGTILQYDGEQLREASTVNPIKKVDTYATIASLGRELGYLRCMSDVSRLIAEHDCGSQAFYAGMLEALENYKNEIK